LLAKCRGGKSGKAESGEFITEKFELLQNKSCFVFLMHGQTFVDNFDLRRRKIEASAGKESVGDESENGGARRGTCTFDVLTVGLRFPFLLMVLRFMLPYDFVNFERFHHRHRYDPSHLAKINDSGA
jgi:hypothetical protein